jgi:hypothetical protein
MFVLTKSNLIISHIDGEKSLDTIAEKAGIFLGSETGLRIHRTKTRTLHVVGYS